MIKRKIADEPRGTVGIAPLEKAPVYWMKFALKEAQKALAKNEVPIGCVIVRDGKVVGRGHNQTESKQDPTAHAEMIAIKTAARRLGSWRLEDCALYVTVAPCAMCRAAISRSRVAGLYWAAPDPQAAYGKNLARPPQEEGGLLAAESQNLLGDFFQALR